jgi:protein arginine kinase
MVGWMKNQGPDNDIVLSTRVRLARNLKDAPFPQLASKERKESIINQVWGIIEKDGPNLVDNFSLIRLNTMPPLDRKIMVEQHLISPNFIDNVDNGAVVINKEQTISIMVNEEDHLRIQAILPGLDLEKGWELCDRVDDMIEEKLDYAFDYDLGYLTSCPTNVGTGLRASVMLHLPALVMTGEINRVLQTVTQIGFAVRGLYGEGTDIIGNVFQLSNQVTLGHGERDIINNLKTIIRQILLKEKMVREQIQKSDNLKLEDRVCRSYGILSNARIITSQEAMKLLSDVRLGVDLGIIEGVNLNQITTLMVEMQPAGLQKTNENAENPEIRDALRAELIRKYINNR